MVTSINAMSQHKLEVARTIDGFENVLVKSLKPSAVQEALFPNNGIYAGRCMSRNSSGETELGCTGNRVPYWLFRTTNLPSTGYSDPQAVQNAPDLTQQDGREHVVLHFAGIEGLEMITSEYVKSSGTAYALNQFLKAPAATGTDDNKVALGGVVTNHEVKYGRDAIVGVVSEMTTQAAYRVDMLQFFTLYRPPIEAIDPTILNGVTEPVWQQ